AEPFVQHSLQGIIYRVGGFHHSLFTIGHIGNEYNGTARRTFCVQRVQDIELHFNSPSRHRRGLSRRRTSLLARPFRRLRRIPASSASRCRSHPWPRSPPHPRPNRLKRTQGNCRCCLSRGWSRPALEQSPRSPPRLPKPRHVRISATPRRP